MEEKREGSRCAFLGGCFWEKLELATNCRRVILMGYIRDEHLAFSYRS